MKNYLRYLAGLFMLASMLLPGAAWAKEDPDYTAFLSNAAAGG